MINYEVVPTEVLSAYRLRPDSITIISGGLINTTYLSEDVNGKIILQKLGNDIPKESTDEVRVYTEHLALNEWEAPVVQPAESGVSYFSDNQSKIWRGLKYIESDGIIPEELNSTLLRNMGGLLARWHVTMSRLDYVPKHTITGFHDLEFHTDKLCGLVSGLKTPESQLLADEVLETTEDIDLPFGNSQLIHGDPKLANMLFRDGQPFTLIDFDTIMYGSKWLDIGDMLRSLISKGSNKYDSLGIIDEVCASYFDKNSMGLTTSEFIRNAILSVQHMATMLTVRFLNDAVEDYYFDWDETKHNSRHDSHVASAAKYFNITKKLMAEVR